jgi:hypothetical protein
MSGNYAHNRAIKTLSAIKDTLSSFLFPCALELLGAAHGPTRRGWTSCPAQARPSWIIRGVCPLHDLMEVGRTWKGKSQHGDLVASSPTHMSGNPQQGVIIIAHAHVRQPTARRPRPRQATSPGRFLSLSPICFSSSVCLELSSVELSLTQRSWTICPARACPSWIIRGACPLHDLMEVRKGEKRREKKRGGKWKKTRENHSE